MVSGLEKLYHDNPEYSSFALWECVYSAGYPSQTRPRIERKMIAQRCSPNGCGGIFIPPPLTWGRHQLLAADVATRAAMLLKGGVIASVF
jgi:hypothetical protein